MKYQIRIGKKQVEIEGAFGLPKGLEKAIVSGQSVEFDAREVPGGVSLIMDGRVYDVIVDTQGAHYHGLQATVSDRGATGEQETKASIAPSGADKQYRAPMPGLIVSVNVKVGDDVVEGQVLLIVEAMKMENEIRAHNAGKISAVHVKAGDRVLQQASLVEMG